MPDRPRRAASTGSPRRRWSVSLAIALVVSLGACGSDDAPTLTPAGDDADAPDGGQSDGGTDVDIAPPDGTDAAGDDGAGPDTRLPAAVALCAAGPALELATVADGTLEEISGLAIDGGARRGVWAIEDSGNDAALHRIGRDGQTRQTVALDLVNTDWEDLAYDHRTGELVIADTGNNLRERSPVQLHAVAVPRGNGNPTVTTTQFTYPDAIPDVEALLIDPLTGDRFLVTKALDQRDFTFESDTVVHRVPPGDPATGTVVAEEVARLQLGLLRTVTGGDIAADGSVIVLRTYDTVLVWDRPPGSTVADAMASEPCEAPAPQESRGEAIALAIDARSYLSIGEDVNAPIWQVSG